MYKYCIILSQKCRTNKPRLEFRWICWKLNLLVALCCPQPGAPVVCWVVEEDSRCRSQPKSRGFTSGWEGVLPEYRQEQGNLTWIYLTRPPASLTEFIFNEVLPLHRFYFTQWWTMHSCSQNGRLCNLSPGFGQMQKCPSNKLVVCDLLGFEIVY
jgi:hypothetical protein